MKKRLASILLCLSFFGVGFVSASGSFESLPDDTAKVMKYSQLTNQLRLEGKTDSAETTAREGLTLARELHWPYGQSTLHNDLAYVYIYKSDLRKAMNHAVKAITIAEDHRDERNKGFANLYIGFVNFSLGEMEDVLPYYRKSLQIRQKIGNPYDLGFTYSYIANYYKGIGQYDSSLYYHDKALAVREQSGDIRSIADSYLLMGGVLDKLGRLDEASEKVRTAFHYYEQLEDQRRMAEAYRNLAEINISQGDIDQAIRQLETSLEFSKKSGAVENLIPLYKELAMLEEKKQHTEKALVLLWKHVQLKDSVDNNSVYRAATKELLRYQAEKEEHIRQLEMQKARAEEERNRAILLANNRRQQYFLIGASVLISLLVVIAVIVVRSLRTTRRQKKVMETQNKEIAASIRYARRIQRAILPPTPLLDQLLPSYFVLYQPKDVVAGDFYWAMKTNNRTMFAVADCTGHGVPGALVSVVCHNVLNRCIREFSLSDPDEILEKTRELVLEELSRSNEEVKDGMDIALCTIEGNNLTYAGAQNPLWIVRASSSSAKKEGAEKVRLLETKADKQPIGNFHAPKPFTAHTVTLQPGDTVYICSDGFADQFGGPRDRKFGSKRLKALLTSIYHHPMEKQKEILARTLSDWMKESNAAQLDDVCIMGVKV